jgi:hypothetical protein
MAHHAPNKPIFLFANLSEARRLTIYIKKINLIIYLTGHLLTRVYHRNLCAGGARIKLDSTEISMNDPDDKIFLTLLNISKATCLEIPCNMHA